MSFSVFGLRRKRISLRRCSFDLFIFYRGPMLVLYEFFQWFHSIAESKHRIMAVMGKAKEAGLPLMKLIKLRGMPILQQLHLEERLLRTSSDNWCLINDGTNSPAIVMGLSGYFFIPLFILFPCFRIIIWFYKYSYVTHPSPIHQRIFYLR